MVCPRVTNANNLLSGALQALYFQYNIRLNNVFDTQVIAKMKIRTLCILAAKVVRINISLWVCQIAHTLLEEQRGKALKHDYHISFVNLLADGRYCGTILFLFLWFFLY